MATKEELRNRLAELNRALESEPKASVAAEIRKFRDATAEHLELLHRADPRSDIETRGPIVRDQNNAPVYSLRSDQSYAKHLNERMSNGGLSDRRRTATDFDVRAYWYGMATGQWKGHEAEQRASMQEGVSADGGYLVPSPVAGQWIDLLRDQIVFAQGNAHTVPWDAGSTLSLPVFV
jgi:HK97 family phage major capsid protein